MHPLNYKKEIETIKGFLIRYDLTNLGDIPPHTITLYLGREERTINMFDIEHLILVNE